MAKSKEDKYIDADIDGYLNARFFPKVPTKFNGPAEAAYLFQRMCTPSPANMETFKKSRRAARALTIAVFNSLKSSPNFGIDIYLDDIVRDIESNYRTECYCLENGRSPRRWEEMGELIGRIDGIRILENDLTFVDLFYNPSIFDYTLGLLQDSNIIDANRNYIYGERGKSCFAALYTVLHKNNYVKKAADNSQARQINRSISGLEITGTTLRAKSGRGYDEFVTDFTISLSKESVKKYLAEKIFSR